MKTNAQKALSRFPWFWRMHFAFHIILGTVAAIAGIVVMLYQEEWLSGLALLGAAAFALVNGIRGFVDLRAARREQRRTTRQAKFYIKG